MKDVVAFLIVVLFAIAAYYLLKALLWKHMVEPKTTDESPK